MHGFSLVWVASPTGPALVWFSSTLRQHSVGRDRTKSLASGAGCVCRPTETLDGPVWTLSVLLQLCGGYILASSLPWAQAPRRQIQIHTCFYSLRTNTPTYRGEKERKKKCSVQREKETSAPAGNSLLKNSTRIFMMWFLIGFNQLWATANVTGVLSMTM